MKRMCKAASTLQTGPSRQDPQKNNTAQPYDPQMSCPRPGRIAEAMIAMIRFISDLIYIL